MKIFLLLLALSQLVLAESMPISSLDDSWVGKPIVVRGFLYRGENEQMFLAGEPNLKSCCVGTARQILLEKASFEPQKTVVELAGLLERKGNQWVLQQPRLIQRPAKDYLAAYLAGLGLLGGFLYFRKQKTKRRCNVG